MSDKNEKLRVSGSNRTEHKIIDKLLIIFLVIVIATLTAQVYISYMDKSSGLGTILSILLGIVASILNVLFQTLIKRGVPTEPIKFAVALAKFGWTTIGIVAFGLIAYKLRRILLPVLLSILKLPINMFLKVIDKKPLQANTIKGKPRGIYTGASFGPGLPPLSILGEIKVSKENIAQAEKMKKNLSKVLQEMGVPVRIGNYEVGPTVTKFYLDVRGSNVRLSSIRSMLDDIALGVCVDTISMSTAQGAVCLEITNEEKQLVTHREVLEELRDRPLKELSIPVGRISNGPPFHFNLEKLPHLLIAGATNMGKSVTLNDIIVSLIVRHNPENLKFVMIDPKRVELAVYASLPHLLRPVCKGPEKGTEALKWLCGEMDKRYEELERLGIKKLHDIPVEKRPFPIIIAIIDELADLLLTSASEVEDLIARLAQKGRASGIHLILATQRPDAKILTGLIRSNVPGRIALKTESGTSSRIILDQEGAEKLAGEGEAYAKIPGIPGLTRFQGSFIEDRHIEAVVGWWKKNYSKGTQAQESITGDSGQRAGGDDEIDSSGLIEDPEEFIEDAEENSGESPEMILRRNICDGVLEVDDDVDINLPTIREIAQVLGVSSFKNIYQIIENLKQDRWIKKVGETKNSKYKIILTKENAQKWLSKNGY